MLTTYACSSLQWLHAGAGSCLVNIMYLINVTFNIHYTTNNRACVRTGVRACVAREIICLDTMAAIVSSVFLCVQCQ